MTVRCHPQASQVANELLAVQLMGGLRAADLLAEVFQVSGGGPIATDHRLRRPEHVLVMVEPTAPQFRDRQRHEREDRRGRDGELGVDLSGRLGGHLFIFTGLPVGQLLAKSINLPFLVAPPLGTVFGLYWLWKVDTNPETLANDRALFRHDGTA
jgi:hypothetical protein